MPNDNKLYLCFEFCDFDLKKYMKSLQYRLSAACIKVCVEEGLRVLAAHLCMSHRQDVATLAGLSQALVILTCARTFLSRSLLRTRC